METDHMNRGTQKRKGRLPVIIAVVLIVAALAAAGSFVVPRIIGIANEEADDLEEEDEDERDGDEREEEIAAIISSAEKLAAENRLERAPARVREGLETYPDAEETPSGGSSADAYLEDVDGQQKMTLSTPVNTSSVTFTILSVYAGSAYQDTAISEISLF